MNKQAYMKPAMRVVKIQHSQMLCLSDVTNAETNLTGDDKITIGGGSSGQGRSRSFGGFDWDGEEE